MALEIVLICPCGFNMSDYTDIRGSEGFVVKMKHETVYALFKAFIINMLNLVDWKNITIFEQAINDKDNGVRGSSEKGNTGGSVAGRAAGVRAHAGNRPGSL